MKATVQRTIDAVANSVAIAPFGAFVAFADNDGVLLDNGKKRFLRGTSKRVWKGNNGYVSAVTDRGDVLCSTVGAAFVVGADGPRTLFEIADQRHPPMSYNCESNIVTAMSGNVLIQFDATSWKELRRADIGEDIDYTHYLSCSSDDGWTILATKSRVVVLDDNLELETEFSADRREWFFTGAGRLVGLDSVVNNASTTVSKLPHDDEREQWEGHFMSWAAAAREFRGHHRNTVVVRTPTGTQSTIELPEPPTARSPAHPMFAYADGASLAVRMRRLQKGLEILSW